MNFDSMINKDGTKKYAYIMLLMISDTYVPASIVLAESLKKSVYSLDQYLDLTTPSAREFAKQYKTINTTWVEAVGKGGGGSKGNGGPVL